MTQAHAIKRHTNPRWTVRVALMLGVFALHTLAFAQAGLNNLWMGGFDSDGPPPFGGVDLNFMSGELEVSFFQRNIGFRRTAANITNTQGELLFSTNGAFVANASGDTMLNGAGLNPSWYTSQYPEGLSIPQAVLIVPKPEDPDIYYLLHSTIDDWVTTIGLYLYVSVIDMSEEGDLGAVVLKNQVLINDSFNYGKLSSVRHANGRDWWVYCHRSNSNSFHRLLVTPEGIDVEGVQSIGIVRTPDGGQTGFSPDGSKFVYYWGDDGLEVFDFDRCSGLFSDPRFTVVEEYANGTGAAFSPNGRFVYISTTFDVFQYDTEAPDLATSEVHIAHWDSTYSPFPPFAALFSNMQLAPDGKIYIGTGNGTDVLHVIHNPDEPGLACNLEQHGIQLERYFSNSLPNHPNYHLGPVDGSVCDSLGINVGVVPPLSLGEGPGVRAYPNPNNGAFMLSYAAQPIRGVLEVRNTAGQLVLREPLPQWSTVHHVELQAAPGMYHAQVRWGTVSTSTRLILAEP